MRRQPVCHGHIGRDELHATLQDRSTGMDVAEGYLAASRIVGQSSRCGRPQWVRRAGDLIRGRGVWLKQPMDMGGLVQPIILSRPVVAFL